MKDGWTPLVVHNRRKADFDSACYLRLRLRSPRLESHASHGAQTLIDSMKKKHTNLVQDGGSGSSQYVVSGRCAMNPGWQQPQPSHDMDFALTALHPL